jgi:hypothetical protein
VRVPGCVCVRGIIRQCVSATGLITSWVRARAFACVRECSECARSWVRASVRARARFPKYRNSWLCVVVRVPGCVGQLRVRVCVCVCGSRDLTVLADGLSQRIIGSI